MSIMRRLPVTAALAAVLVTGICLATLAAENGASEDRRAMAQARDLVDRARFTFSEMLDTSPFKQALPNAKALVIFPDVSQAEILTVEGEAPAGLMLTRQPDGTWEQPAFYRLGSQPSMEMTDIVLVVTDEGAVDALASGEAVLGEDVTVASGPSALEEDLDPQAGVLTFARQHGQLSDLSFEGMSIEADAELTSTYYGADVTVRDVLEGNSGVASLADRLIDAVEEATLGAG